MDDGKIIKLVPNTSAPSADALAMIDEVREKLASGELTAVAFAGIGGGRELHTAWYGYCGDLVTPCQLLAARLMADLRGQ